MRNWFKILPLKDEPVPQCAERHSADCGAGHRGQGLAQFSEWLDTVMHEADVGGYVSVSYPEVLRVASQSFGEGADYLDENPWVLRNHLESAGYMAAPDSALERRRLKANDSLVLYRTGDFVPMIRSRGYKKGLLLVKFLTLAFSPMTATELTAADQMLARWVGPERYRRHLGALLRWFNTRKRLLDARTKRVFGEIMTTADKETLALQLVTMAGRRGMSLSVRSLQQLDRMLQMCGRAPGEVHSLLHRESLIDRRRDAFPVPSSGAVALDKRRLSSILESTRKVQSLLAPVMESHDEAPAIDVPARESDATGILLNLLGEKEVWPLSELEQKYSSLVAGMPLGVALEELNDLAYEKAGDAAAEQDEGNIYVNLEVIGTLKNEQR